MIAHPLRVVRRLLPVLAATVVLSWSATALAQSSVVLNEATIKTSFDNDRTFEPLSISHEDCVSDQTYTFQVAITQPVGDLEVWIGSACATPAAGTLTPPTGCRRLFTDNALQSMTFDLRAQEIVAKSIGDGAGTVDVCESTGSDDAKKVTLFFMLLISGDIVDGHIADTWSTNYDLIGPEPPENVTAGVGENGIPLEWDASDSDDVSSYNFYCDPKAGGASATSTTQAAGDDGGDAASDVGAAGATSDAGTGAASGTGGAAGSSATGGTGAAGGTVSSAEGGINAECPSSVIIGGQRPDEANQCGSQGDGTTGAASGLRNGEAYTVAVAGVDNLGNVGPLSTPVCGTPTDLIGFTGAYNNAGGRGGGGCSFGASSASSASILVLGALALRRIRRRFR
jgi:hypothetical protein